MKDRSIENRDLIFPSIWAKLHSDLNKEQEELNSFLAENNIPCDLSSQPSLWGHFLPKWKGPCLLRGTFEYENVTDSNHAHNLITAYLLQTLCNISRSIIDLFVLPIRKEIPKNILKGIKETFYQAKEEQLVKSLGAFVLDSSEDILNIDTLYDCFDVIIVPESKFDKYYNDDSLQYLNIIYETSSIISSQNSNISQIILIKTMKEIYSVKKYLDAKKEVFK